MRGDGRHMPISRTRSSIKQLDGLEISLQWSRRRQSIGLLVTAEGTLTVRAPYGTALKTIQEAVRKHRAWIDRKLAERKEAWTRLPRGVAYFLGQPYRLMVAPAGDEAVYLEAAEKRLRLNPEGSGLWPPLRAWYLREADRRLRARVRDFAACLGLKVGRVELADWQRRWGECHPGPGLLRFNWRLIMLPPEVLDYVVVHELTHLKVPGHSPRFWQEVGGVLPDYASRRRWLNRYGTPFLSWQPTM